MEFNDIFNQIGKNIIKIHAAKRIIKLKISMCETKHTLKKILYLPLLVEPMIKIHNFQLPNKCIIPNIYDVCIN